MVIIKSHSKGDSSYYRHLPVGVLTEILACYHGNNTCKFGPKKHYIWVCQFQESLYALTGLWDIVNLIISYTCFLALRMTQNIKMNTCIVAEKF